MLKLKKAIVAFANFSTPNKVSYCTTQMPTFDILKNKSDYFGSNCLNCLKVLELSKLFSIMFFIIGLDDENLRCWWHEDCFKTNCEKRFLKSVLNFDYLNRFVVFYIAIWKTSIVLNIEVIPNEYT